MSFVFGPLGAWLPDAYPEATATGAVFVTALPTKSAVYALIRGLAGTEILVVGLPCEHVIGRDEDVVCDGDQRSLVAASGL